MRTRFGTSPALAPVLAAAAVATATVAWAVFLQSDLILSHYDARAHLVVARRIVDNITPGWKQLGGVWLPLPHILNAAPVQLDWVYRTGIFASFVSIACLGVLTYAAARLVLMGTGSRLGAAVAAALLVLNPNLLYLHTTPMTEPLLLALTFIGVLWVSEWVALNDDRVPWRLGVILFAAAWTRYEAWLVIAAALCAVPVAAVRTGASPAAGLRRAVRLACWPAAAVAAFFVLSRISTGAWFVADGFYEREPIYDGHLAKDLLAVWWGTHQLSTRTTELIGLAGAVLVTFRALVRRVDAPLLVHVSLFASAVLPVYAFYEGHPFRIRYMVPVVAACAVFSGMAIGYLRKQAPLVLAGLLVGITLLQSPPWQSDAPMLVEAQLDAESRAGRATVTRCLMSRYGGEKILASMGSLAHYMHELASEGLPLVAFVHEGNGIIWDFALESGPLPHAGWMLVEEQAEQGDTLARRIRDDPQFARGMERICEGGGVALYTRTSQK